MIRKDKTKTNQKIKNVSNTKLNSKTVPTAKWLHTISGKISFMSAIAFFLMLVIGIISLMSINENSKKNKEEKKIETMNGYYKIIMIDNEKNSIIIENIENDNDVKTIYYVPNGDLLSKTEEIKKSVGDPNKIFKIKFEAIKKREKTVDNSRIDIYLTNENHRAIMHFNRRKSIF